MDKQEQLSPAEKRFGMIAIEKGYITKEQLTDALKTQVEEEVEHGIHRFIGAILMEMKVINAQQLRSVVDLCMNRGSFVS